MIAMFYVAVFFVCLLCQSGAEFIAVKHRCNDSSIEPDVSYSTFTPSLDGIEGRYTAELCTFNKPERTLLTMDLTYDKDSTVCDPESRRLNRRRARKPGPQHSSNKVNVSGLATCRHVCYAMDFDLIFSSCYLLKSTLSGEHITYSPHDSYFLIKINTTSENYNKTAPYVNLVNHEDHFTLDWFLGIPALDYKVTLHKINNDTMTYLDDGIEVTQNCTLSPNAKELSCQLSPPYGCYQASFEHGGAWTAGVFQHKKFVSYDNLCHLQLEEPVVAPRVGRAVWWVCGAALLGGAALLAVALLRRHLLRRDYHKRVLDLWFNNREPDAEAAVTRDSRAVLLLYAREGEHGQQAMAALKELIQHSTGGTVYDIFSPEVMALCGPAPHSWVRGLLQRDDVRVLLVQSPATAALYQDQLYEHEGGLRLRSPLLGHRALYRAPHFGDTLLKMALRQMAESAESHQDYNKYYLATYLGLETDILPSVVSYRRYVLPDAALVLGADLAHVVPDSQRLAELGRSVHALLQHVQHNPNYLMDEIFIN